MVKGIRVILAFAILIVLIASSSPAPVSSKTNPPASASATPPSGLIQLVEADQEHIVLELTAPEPQVTAVVQDGQTCQNAHMAGLLPGDTPGWPALPRLGQMVGIPENARPTVRVLASEAIPLASKVDLCPVGKQVAAEISSETGTAVATVYERNPQVYQSTEPIPQALVELVSTGKIRSQPFAELRFNPLQYNPASGELFYTRRMRVEVYFNVVENAQGIFNNIKETYFEESLRDLLINYEQARGWRTQPARSPATLGNAPQAVDQYKIQVNQDGIYQLTYTDLANAGLPVSSLDPRTFQLFNQGVEVALNVIGEADGVFDASDAVLFYGQKINTKYTNTNVYWLSYGVTNGLRMAVMDGAPSSSATTPDTFFTTLHAEKDVNRYTDLPSGSDQDRWYWGEVYAGSGPAYTDFPITLTNIASGSQAVVVRGLMRGYTATPNHHTRVYLNGNLIDDATYPSGAEHSFSFVTDQSSLLEGANTIRVECPFDGGISLDLVEINWFEIDYTDTYLAESDRLFFDGDQAGAWEFHADGFTTADIEAFDISQPLAPVLVSGGTVSSTANGNQLAFEATITEEHHYLAQTTAQRLSPLSLSLDSPSSWKSSANGADYLIITHADFLSSVQPLANFRLGQGLRVQVIDVQDLYDEFNGGVFSPLAIQSFLAYAFANWEAPAPSYVLLVGDGHYDFKNNQGINEKNYLPPYLADVDPAVGETAADNRYVTVSGNDILPDMFLGRFPVRSTAEAQAMVNKVINYEQNPPVGGWNANLTFVADNADSGGVFDATSDYLINTYVPASYTSEKIYYGVNYTSVSATQTAIKNAINQGRLIVHYAGHGAIPYWAVEKLFQMSYVAGLTNGVKQPFMLPMTCQEGYFINPSPAGKDYSSLAETIVRATDKGAIASFSATGWGQSLGHDIFDNSIFDDLFNNAYTGIGYLTTQAKYYLYAHSSSYMDLLDTYLLLGDPALKLQTLPLAAPAAPTNLQATTISPTQIDLSWQTDSKGMSEFRIERSPDGLSSWTEIAVVDNAVTSYSDDGLTAGTSYYYRLRAYRTGDQLYSDYGNIASATTFVSHTFQFSPGWSLITLPSLPATAYDAETFLRAINLQDGNCVEIDQWMNGGWNSHSLGLPFGLFPITLGESYFVRCTSESSLILEGSPVTSGVTLALNPGWNLVGMPYPSQGYTAQGLLDAIKLQGGACPEIDRWVNGGWESHLDGLPFANFDILPFEGYFVRCSQASSFTP